MQGEIFLYVTKILITMQFLQYHMWIPFRGSTCSVCSWDTALGICRMVNVPPVSLWYKQHLPRLLVERWSPEPFHIGSYHWSAVVCCHLVGNNWSMCEPASPTSLACLAYSARIWFLAQGWGAQQSRMKWWSAVRTERLFVVVEEGGEELRLVVWSGTRSQWALD